VINSVYRLAQSEKWRYKFAENLHFIAYHTRTIGDSNVRSGVRNNVNF